MCSSDRDDLLAQLARVLQHQTRAAMHRSRRIATAACQDAGRRLHALERRAVLYARRKRMPYMSDDYVRGGAEIMAVLFATAAVTVALRRGLAVYNTVDDIPAKLIRRNAVLHGSVVAVRDGDGVRIRHVPFLKRLFNAYMPPQARNIAHSTINVRLAAVDAPECVSFGRKGQKYGPIARDWLKEFVVGRKVSVQLHAVDQYRRVVGTVHRKHDNPLLRVLGIGRKNLSLELTRAGYATLYEGAGAQYGSERLRRAYVKAEKIARRKGIGMWAQKGSYVSPAEYKRNARTGNNDVMRSGILTRSMSKALGRRDLKNSVPQCQQVSSLEVNKNGFNAEANDQHSQSLIVTVYQFMKVSYEYLKQFRK